MVPPRDHPPPCTSILTILALRYCCYTARNMDQPRPHSALFDVFLRLRPGQQDRDRFLDVEDSEQHAPTHITIKPPANDTRRRAVERFAFTSVFEENAGQRTVFESTGAVQLIEGVLGEPGREGRDGLMATLGVTGSGKVKYTATGSI